MNTSRIALLIAASFLAGAVNANLLNNPGFEEAGEHDEAARYWRMNDPNDHGDAWGSAIRIDWRATEGRFIGAVRGTWADAGDYGGFWQEAEIEAGTTYKAAAWFWADAGWRAETQELKIEFWNTDRSEMIAAETIGLDDVGEIWVQKEVSGRAPEGAGWARVVINVAGSGDSGALQVDQVTLESSW
ncbi:MAG TPA: hypothetical protein PKE26_14790 [Kiritimatiellia bacterium]|nr:hypothetical protein [Kiritimatiellia bacterium]HMP00367.1 hypothetical protein [Kiritimatiellia bacterium]HMP98055.1 hypothetical protein [Kiritimatiellia bacterium]